MQVSAEMRWFWQSRSPDDIATWFKSTNPLHPCAVGGGASPRTDLYRRGGDTEIGIKLRGNKPGFEIKGLVATLRPVSQGPFAGTPTLWTKWTVQGLRIDAEEVVATTKLRWIRKLDTSGSEPREVALGPDELPVDPGERPATGCQVELTEVSIGEERWWSLGFESFGALDSVERSLQMGIEAMARRGPPTLPNNATAADYPSWLKAWLESARPATTR